MKITPLSGIMSPYVDKDFDVINASLQEIFDAVSRHLIMQGEQAVSPGDLGVCLYYDPDKNICCAAGAVLPAELYCYGEDEVRRDYHDPENDVFRLRDGDSRVESIGDGLFITRDVVSALRRFRAAMRDCNKENEFEELSHNRVNLLRVLQRCHDSEACWHQFSVEPESADESEPRKGLSNFGYAQLVGIAATYGLEFNEAEAKANDPHRRSVTGS